MKFFRLALLFLLPIAAGVAADADSPPAATTKTIAVTIIGEVKKPGEYHVPVGSTFMDVVTLAGGRETRGWEAGPIRILRKRADGTTITFSFDAQKQDAAHAAAILQESDVIVVPTVL